MFMNNGSSLVRPESVLQMQTVVRDVILYENINATDNESVPVSTQYGISWSWQTLANGRRYLGHDGSMPGVATSMLITENGDYGVILLTNGDVYPNNNISINVYLTLSKLRLAFLECFEN